MIPLLPALLSAVTSIPTIIRSIRALKPVKDKILEAERAFPLPDDANPETKKVQNERKRTHVQGFLDKYVFKFLERHGLTRKDLDILFQAFVILSKQFTAIKAGLKDFIKSRKRS